MVGLSVKFCLVFLWFYARILSYNIMKENMRQGFFENIMWMKKWKRKGQIRKKSVSLLFEIFAFKVISTYVQTHFSTVSWDDENHYWHIFYLIVSNKNKVIRRQIIIIKCSKDPNCRLCRKHLTTTISLLLIFIGISAINTTFHLMRNGTNIIQLYIPPVLPSSGTHRCKLAESSLPTNLQILC